MSADRGRPEVIGSHNDANDPLLTSVRHVFAPLAITLFKII